MESLLQDVRYGLRAMLRSPGFTVVAVIALALGIGANAAIFSIVNSILLKPLAYEDPERLVLINHNYPKLDLKASVSVPGFLHYRDHNRSFESVAASSGWEANLTGQGEPERLRGRLVTANFFRTLG